MAFGLPVSGSQPHSTCPVSERAQFSHSDQPGKTFVVFLYHIRKGTFLRTQRIPWAQSTVSTVFSLVRKENTIALVLQYLVEAGHPPLLSNVVLIHVIATKVKNIANQRIVFYQWLGQI